MKKIVLLLSILLSTVAAKSQTILDMSWDSVTVAPAGTVTVNFTITNSGFQSVSRFKGSIHFNANKFSFVSVGNFGIPGMSTSDFNTSLASSNGTITFDWQHIVSLGVTVTNGNAAFSLTFLATGNPGDFTNITMTNSPVICSYNQYWMGNNLSYTRNTGYISIQGSTPCTPPDADFTTNPGSALNYSFQNYTIGTAPITWSWDFGDGNTSTAMHPTHSYANNSPYNVCLTATNACGVDSFCDVVPCSPPSASANFIHSGLDVSFTNTSSSIDAMTYNWDFGDGATSTQQSPSHAYSAPGTYTATLIAQNACTSDTFTTTVEVCTTSVSVINTSIDTATGAVQFSSDGPPNGIYYWDFGDGNTSTSTAPTHTFANGSYTVTVTVVDPDCRDTATISTSVVLGIDDILSSTYTIYPNPTSLDFQIDGLSSSDLESLMIYDVLGREVKAWKGANLPSSFDAKELISGEYLIIYEDRSGQKYSSKLSKY